MGFSLSLLHAFDVKKRGVFAKKINKNENLLRGESVQKKVRGPGIEPGSTAWKAAMLTITPATPRDEIKKG